jgi:hypothetical protein
MPKQATKKTKASKAKKADRMVQAPVASQPGIPALIPRSSQRSVTFANTLKISDR